MDFLYLTNDLRTTPTICIRMNHLIFETPVMAISAHSFSPGQVWFKPLNNLQRNVGESLLTVCVPPTGNLILTGGISETFAYAI